MLPAIGQGVIAIEARAKDQRIGQLVESLNHFPTELCFTAERAFLQRLGGGCQVPIAGLAQIGSGRIHLRALVAATDGREIIRGRVEGPSSRGEVLGKELAEELLEKGASDILYEVEKKG